MRFSVKKILVDRKVKDFDLTKRILKNSTAPYEIVNSNDIDRCSINQGKKTILITSHKGDLIKQCPGTGDPYICCRYFVINQLIQCPMDCTYCILQNYLSSAYLIIYVDIDLIFKEAEIFLKKQPHRLFRMGSGELTDSLALDYLSEITTDFMKFFSRKKNTIIEFKTKTDTIENILELPINNAVVSWSLNPQELVSKYEAGSASLKERLAAARKCQDTGFMLGFHFDPILYVRGWEKLYKEVINQVFSSVDSSRIAWISMGSLRYPPDLKKIMKNRFPGHQIIYEEMISGLDGKMRYPRPLRIEMYKTIYHYLKSKDTDLFVYFCMESADVWERVMGKSPESDAELDYWFAESIKSRFPEINMDVPDKNDYLRYPDERLTYKNKS
ncbi:MAG: radical SAM protein [bacterium]